MDQTTSPQEKISARAYELWVKSGGQHGQDQDHWFQAEQEVNAAPGSAAAPTVKLPQNSGERQAMSEPVAEKSKSRVSPAVRSSSAPKSSRK